MTTRTGVVERRCTSVVVCASLRAPGVTGFQGEPAHTLRERHDLERSARCRQRNEALHQKRRVQQLERLLARDALGRGDRHAAAQAVVEDELLAGRARQLLDDLGELGVRELHRDAGLAHPRRTRELDRERRAAGRELDRKPGHALDHEADLGAARARSCLGRHAAKGSPARAGDTARRRGTEHGAGDHDDEGLRVALLEAALERRVGEDEHAFVTPLDVELDAIHGDRSRLAGGSRGEQQRREQSEADDRAARAQRRSRRSAHFSG